MEVARIQQMNVSRGRSREIQRKNCLLNLSEKQRIESEFRLVYVVKSLERREWVCTVIFRRDRPGTYNQDISNATPQLLEPQQQRTAHE
jgi:hypothetical protein